MSNIRSRPPNRSPHSIDTNMFGQSNPSVRESSPQRTPASEFAQFHERRTVCAHYELKREIARGGMAVVHEAVDRNTGKHVALKMVPASEFPSVSPRFLQREIAALSKVRHQNVVGFVEGGDHDSDQFLVMEYLDGKTLRDLMVEYDQLPWEIARPILVQLCDALQAVHDANMVHSDVKPANIILSGDSENPVVKLLDFGIVRFTDAPDGDASRVEEGNTLGTPKYMAPEQAKGCTSFDHRADIYAVGTIMYELLTGQGPFQGTRLLELFQTIANVVPEPPADVVPGLSPVLSEITMKALAKDPAERFSSAKEMADAIRACQ